MPITFWTLYCTEKLIFRLKKTDNIHTKVSYYLFSIYSLLYICISFHFLSNHCKPGGEGQIQLTLLLRLWDTVAPLVLILRTSVRKANLYGYISRIQNIFVLFNSFSVRGDMIKTFEILILRAFYFSLTWSVVPWKWSFFFFFNSSDLSFEIKQFVLWVEILPLGSGSVNLHIFANPKHWL